MSVYRAWLPIFTLAFGVFIFNTTEFIPIGLLTNIAQSFQITNAKAGLVITIYAWIVSLLSLPLTIITSKIDRRKLMIGLFALFVLSHIAAFFAQSFEMLIATRISVALAHAIFWSIVLPLAVRLTPNGKREKTIGFIVAGSSLATVLGVPIGTLIGQYGGWQTTFLCIAIVGSIVLIFFTILLPKMSNENVGSFKSLPILFKRPALIGIYLLTALVVSAYFLIYTYITPFMARNFDDTFIVFLLLLIGGAGIVGSIIFAKFSRNKKLLPSSICIFITALALFDLCSKTTFGAAGACFALGTSMILIHMSLQSKLLDNAKEAADVANSIYSSIFNIGIGAGSFAGSFVLAYLDISFLGYAAAAISTTAFILYTIFIKRHLYK